MHLPRGRPRQHQMATPYKNSMCVPSFGVKPIDIFFFVSHEHLYKLQKAELGTVPSTCWYQSTYLWYGLPGPCWKSIGVNRVFGWLPGKKWTSPGFTTSNLDFALLHLGDTQKASSCFSSLDLARCQVGLWNQGVGFGWWSWSEPLRATFDMWLCLAPSCLLFEAPLSYIILQEASLHPCLADSTESCLCLSVSLIYNNLFSSVFRVRLL